ncbi:MAG: hypothetical protein HND44_19220 [Chloroflexi bacterium]|nr:hypothetical protein [Ardenticatenaceae bacterium]NOG36676.1 hypothetical protein [Chloroflexota bacterium]
MGRSGQFVKLCDRLLAQVGHMNEGGTGVGALEGQVTAVRRLTSGDNL